MRLFFTLVFIHLLYCAQGQLPVVEVIVEDSVMIMADEIVYTVLVSQDYNVDTFDMAVEPTDANAKAAQPFNSPLPMDTLREIVRSLRLDTLTDAAYTVNNLPYNSNQDVLHVRFNSLAGLQEFVRRIRAIKNISGTIGSVKSANEQPALNKLYQRLLKEARNQATMLAQAAGKRLGVVLSVKEQPSEGGWTMYPPLSSVIPGWHTTVNGNGSAYVVLQKKLLVQFNWQ